MTKLVVGTVAGALLLGLAAGCGGGDDASLTKAQFIKQGNKICKRALQDRERTLKGAINALPQGQQPTAAQQEKIVGVILPDYAQILPQLEDLGAPEGEEQKVEAVLAEFESELGNVEGNPKLALTGAGFRKSNKAFSDYGLTDCTA